MGGQRRQIEAIVHPKVADKCWMRPFGRGVDVWQNWLLRKIVGNNLGKSKMKMGQKMDWNEFCDDDKDLNVECRPWGNEGNGMDEVGWNEYSDVV